MSPAHTVACGDGGRFPLMNPEPGPAAPAQCGPISFSQQMLVHCEDGNTARTHLHWDEQDGGILTNSSAASLNSPSVRHRSGMAGPGEEGLTSYRFWQISYS